MGQNEKEGFYIGLSHILKEQPSSTLVSAKQSGIKEKIEGKPIINSVKIQRLKISLLH